jgi:pimeloyl-ACP methyl ester carboxylesterase
LTLPVELIHGTADTSVPITIHSLPLSRLLPHAHLTVVEGAGHMPHHAHPQLVVDAIARAALR